MRALVVYESMFGDTRQIATEVAAGLTDAGLAVEVTEVAAAPAVLADDIGLLVVGAPTHAFSLSRPSTRQSAAEQAPGGPDSLVSTGIGVREWLDTLAGGSSAPRVATFDSRVHVTGLPGSAAKAAMRRLRRHGFRSAARPVSFYVAGTTGPPVSGELARARAWGADLGAAFVPQP